MNNFKPTRKSRKYDSISGLSGYLYIAMVLVLLLFYCRYSHPIVRLIDAGKWWKGFVQSLYEVNDTPYIVQYGQMDLSKKKSDSGIYSDRIISSIEKDSTIQINVSDDSYPNGFKEIPFRVDKAMYSEKSTLLPMYWSAPCPAWIEITWLNEQIIDRIEITPNNDEYGMGEYRLLVWDQGRNKYIPSSPMVSYSGRAGRFKAFNLSSTTTSRVKISIHKGGYLNNNAYLKDVKVFGHPLEDL